MSSASNVRLRDAASSKASRRGRRSDIDDSDEDSNGNDDEDDKDRGAAANTTNSRVDNFPSYTGPWRSDMSPVEFMQEKTRMLQQAQGVLQEGKGRKSVRTRLTVLAPKLNKEQLDQLEESPTDLCNKLAQKDEKLAKASSDMEAVKVAGWMDSLEKLLNEIHGAQLLRSKGEELLKAMDFMAKQLQAKRKSNKNAARYKLTRMANKMGRQGFPAQFSTHMASRIANINSKKVGSLESIATNPEVFASDKVTLWTKPCGSTGGDGDGDGGDQKVKLFNDKVKEMFNKCEKVSAKKTSLESTMAENREWPGAMCKVECDGIGHTRLPGFEKTEPPNSKGSTPWAMLIRPFGWRYGPEDTPMPGLGNLIFMDIGGDNTATDCDMFVALVEVSEVLKKGISLGDVHAFLNTDAGVELFANSGVVVRVSIAEALFVPYGWLYMPTAVPLAMLAEDNNDDEEARPMPQYKNLFCIIATVVDKGWISAVPTKSWDAVVTFNDDFLKSVANQRPWASRATFFAELLSSLTT